MTAVPAQVAGVRRIVVACPKANPALLAAAELLGIEEIAHIGGAQAIAALAYGTRSVPRVDKIFGPGNRYVTAAKRSGERRLRHRYAGWAHGSSGCGHARRGALHRRRSDRAGRARCRRRGAVCHDFAVLARAVREPLPNS